MSAFFSFDVQEALDWLQAVEVAARSGHAVPEQYQCPSGTDLALSPQWSAREPAGPALIHDLLRSARELGILRGPEGVEVLLLEGEGHYRWEIECDRYYGLTLAGPLEDPGTLGDSIWSGAQCALIVLRQAVDAANAMLDTLHAAVPRVMADNSTDPVVLARLAESDDALVLRSVLDNQDCPDEARVMIALRGGMPRRG